MWEPGTQILDLHVEMDSCSKGFHVVAIMNPHVCINTMQHVRLLFMYATKTTLTQRNSLIHCGTQDYNYSLWNLVCGRQIVTLLGPCCYLSMRCPDRWCDNGCTGDAPEYYTLQHYHYTEGTYSHPTPFPVANAKAAFREGYIKGL